MSSSFSLLRFEQFFLYKTGGHFWTKSCLTLGVKTFGRATVEQRLKWLHKALAIEVKKPLKLEAVRPSLLIEGTDLIFFGKILCNVATSPLGLVHPPADLLLIK